MIYDKYRELQIAKYKSSLFWRLEYIKSAILGRITPGEQTLLRMISKDSKYENSAIDIWEKLIKYRIKLIPVYKNRWMAEYSKQNQPDYKVIIDISPISAIRSIIDQIERMNNEK